jgi:hypothetical protein
MEKETRIVTCYLNEFAELVNWSLGQVIDKSCTRWFRAVKRRLESTCIISSVLAPKSTVFHTAPVYMRSQIVGRTRSVRIDGPRESRCGRINSWHKLHRYATLHLVWHVLALSQIKHWVSYLNNNKG